MNVVVISRIKCEFATQLSRAGDQGCRLPDLKQNPESDPDPGSEPKNFLKSRIWVRSRIKNKLYRINNPLSKEA